MLIKLSRLGVALAVCLGLLGSASTSETTSAAYRSSTSGVALPASGFHSFNRYLAQLRALAAELSKHNAVNWVRLDAPVHLTSVTIIPKEAAYQSQPGH